MSNEPGLSLLDIGVAHEDVPVGNKKLKVYGISAETILNLFQRFPSLKGVIGGGLKATDMLGLAPEALSAIIAAGCGSPNDEDAEAVARKLAVETQLDILEAIGRLSFKSGFGPFVKRILALADKAESVSSGKVPGMNSPPPSKPLPQSGATPVKSGS